MHRHLLTACLLLCVPGSVSTQIVTLGGPVSESDLLYLAGEPQLAFELLESHLGSHPTDYDALWRVVRAAVVLGMAEEGASDQNRWLDPAVFFAERAVEVWPDGLEGRYWHGLAVGRRATNARAGYGAQLNQRVYEDAHALLDSDPRHAGAHNMLGKLNYEIMSASRFERAYVRFTKGNQALSEASWEDAQYHLERAVEITPESVLYRFDLAQLYWKRGPRSAAVEEFQRVLDLAPAQPLDALLQAQVRILDIEEVSR